MMMYKEIHKIRAFLESVRLGEQTAADSSE